MGHDIIVNSLKSVLFNFYLSFFFNDTATTEIYTYGHTLSLHDALPIYIASCRCASKRSPGAGVISLMPWRSKVASNCRSVASTPRSEEHTSELQSLMRISYAVFCLKKQNQKRKLTL